MINRNDPELKQALLPIKLIWAALTFSVVIHNFVILQILEFKFQINLASVLNPLYLSTWCGFVVVYMLSTRVHKLIKESDTVKTPYFVPFTEENKKVLRFMPKYMLWYILLWALNEAVVILAFVFSMTSKNYTYLLVSSIFFFALNIFILKPNYLDFVARKDRPHEL